MPPLPPKQPVGILLIATNKYKQFVQPLIDSLNENFLTDRELIVFLFTDFPELPLNSSNRLTIKKYKIPNYKFPEATLYRYKIFTHLGSEIYQGCSHLFYMDVDMKVVAPVGEEILDFLVATRHPGFYNGGGSWGNNPESTSYTSPGNRRRYYAGGFQGGELATFLTVMYLLDKRIDIDKANGVMAEWHDETHWNKYLADSDGFKELTPDYCMVEQKELRQQWGIDHFEPKILALEKNLEEIRS